MIDPLSATHGRRPVSWRPCVALSRIMALAAATAEEYFPHAEVPILDDDVDDGYFEPDGVNDFVRDAEAWDPDREF